MANLTVIKKGSTIYYRVKWSATHDYVCGFNLNTAIKPYDNNNVNFINEGLILSSTIDFNVPTTAYTSTLKTSTDDTCPININGTYIGANHGGAFVIQITAAYHDKQIRDIGSEWKDINGKKWYIMRIVDANTLWVISEVQPVSHFWGFLTSVGGNLLLHNSGATSTGTIAITANVIKQLWPAYKNTLKSVLLDGVNEIIADGVYTCNFLEVLHAYDIFDIPSVIALTKSPVDPGDDPDAKPQEITKAARITNTYRVTENGAVTVYTTFKTNQQVYLNYAGFVQSFPISTPSGGSIHAYAPKIIPHVVAGRMYDFSAIQDITVYADTHEINAPMWADVNNPPERYVQFVKNATGVKTYGNAMGYNQRVGMGQPAIRKTLINSAWYFYSSKKMYPKGITGGSTAYPTYKVPANTVFDMVSFRYPINYEANPNLTNFGWYSVGSDVYVNIDAHTTIASQSVQLPPSFTGMQIDVVEKNSGFTVNSMYVGQDGINFSVTNYGTAVLRLYK